MSAAHERRVMTLVESGDLCKYKCPCCAQVVFKPFNEEGYHCVGYNVRKFRTWNGPRPVVRTKARA